jgi:hypothetical protein
VTREQVIDRFRIDGKTPPEIVVKLFAAAVTLSDLLGDGWIDEIFSPGSFTVAMVPYVLSSYRALQVTDRVRNGRALRDKLLAERFAFGSKSMAEAEVARRLLSLGSSLEYEPVDLAPKVPDFSATWEKGIRVIFEVSKLELSHEDKVQWHQRQTELADKMNTVLKGGSTDVYINQVTLVESDMNRIVNALKEAVAHPYDDYQELMLDDEILLVYDRTGSVRSDRSNPPPESAVGLRDVTIIEDPQDDRSARILRQYFPGVSMRGIGCVSAFEAEPGHNRANIVRVHKAAEDRRLFAKVIAEANQLSSDYPGIVALDLSNTTAKPSKWAAEVSSLFEDGLYSVVGAVWMRAGLLSDYGSAWDEYLSLNERTARPIPDVVLSAFSNAANISME